MVLNLRQTNGSYFGLVVWELWIFWTVVMQSYSRYLYSYSKSHENPARLHFMPFKNTHNKIFFKNTASIWIIQSRKWNSWFGVIAQFALVFKCCSKNRRLFIWYHSEIKIKEVLFRNKFSVFAICMFVEIVKSGLRYIWALIGNFSDSHKTEVSHFWAFRWEWCF